MDLLIERASSYAGDIDRLILVITVIVGGWFLAAELVFFWLIFKFRAKDGVKADYLDGSNPKHKRWVAWPHYAILGFDVIIIVMAIRVWHDVKIARPQTDAEVRIMAQQWAWAFTHPGKDGKFETADDIRTGHDMYVEVGRTYKFQIESRDVLHSFSVPVFRLKQDTIPGRVITGWFKPTKTGEWDIQCTEMCGIGHGIMGARIHVQSPEDHAAWVAASTPAPPAPPAPVPAPAPADGAPAPPEGAAAPADGAATPAEGTAAPAGAAPAPTTP